MAADHPTPWRLSRGGNGGIFDADDEYVGSFRNDRLAYRVIDAVNAHDDLVKALDEALAFVAAWGGTYQAQHGLSDLHPKHQETLDKVQAALAKAREPA